MTLLPPYRYKNNREQPWTELSKLQQEQTFLYRLIVLGVFRCIRKLTDTNSISYFKYTCVSHDVQQQIIYVGGP